MTLFDSPPRRYLYIFSLISFTLVLFSCNSVLSTTYEPSLAPVNTRREIQTNTLKSSINIIDGILYGINKESFSNLNIIKNLLLGAGDQKHPIINTKGISPLLLHSASAGITLFNIPVFSPTKEIYYLDLLGVYILRRNCDNEGYCHDDDPSKNWVIRTWVVFRVNKSDGTSFQPYASTHIYETENNNAMGKKDFITIDRGIRFDVYLFINKASWDQECTNGFLYDQKPCKEIENTQPWLQPKNLDWNSVNYRSELPEDSVLIPIVYSFSDLDCMHAFIHPECAEPLEFP